MNITYATYLPTLQVWSEEAIQKCNQSMTYVPNRLHIIYPMEWKRAREQICTMYLLQAHIIEPNEMC